LRAIKAGAFEKVLREKLEQGALYVGASAGTYVACPTIEMGEWNHDKKYSAYEGQDLAGMHLVPFLVKVHYEPKYEEDIRKGMKDADVELYILTDEQALFIEDGKVTFLGEGERINIQ